ncbi:MAG: serine/threonine protein kinase [Anaerolineales bacterium]
MERIPTHIPGLDEILYGGLPAHSTTLISGGPGSGKTILASQIVFRNASPQHKAIFVSTVSEPLGRILRYTQEFDFFEPSLPGETILYEDIGPDLLAGNGVRAVDRLEQLLLQHRPAFLVIDSVRALSALSESPAVSRRNLFRLAALLTALPCTTLLVGEYQAHEYAATVEASIVDGVILLNRRQESLRDQRTLRVNKLRGSDYIPGEHTFRISRQGITLFPRFTTPPAPAAYTPSRSYAPTGIPGFDDEMLPGSLPRGAAALLVGDPGVGKTVTALHFLLNGIKQGEAGVYISFQEDPNQLVQIARNFGFDTDALTAGGKLTLLYASPVELDIDEHAQVMLAAIQKIGARRVVIDSIGDLEAGAHSSPDRYFNFVYSLAQWFKDNGVTALLTGEMSGLFGSELTLTGRGVSHIADTIILLRYTELDGEIRRALTVLAARGSDHSKQVREYLISEKEGPRIGAPLHHTFSMLNPTRRKD